jgi:hypothetical protein
MAEEVSAGHEYSESGGEVWYVFPPKFFPVPAQYENTRAQKFYRTSITPVNLTYPNTRIQCGKIVATKWRISTRLVG